MEANGAVPWLELAVLSAFHPVQRARRGQFTHPVRVPTVAAALIGCLALALLYVGGRWLAERSSNQALKKHVLALKRKLAHRDT